MFHSAALLMADGKKPIIVHSDWHSGCYKTNLDTEGERIHKELLQTVNKLARTNKLQNKPLSITHCLIVSCSVIQSIIKIIQSIRKMKFDLTLKFLDEEGEELTSSVETIYADDLNEANQKAQIVFNHSTADDFELTESF